MVLFFIALLKVLHPRPKPFDTQFRMVSATVPGSDRSWDVCDVAILNFFSVNSQV